MMLMTRFSSFTAFVVTTQKQAVVSFWTNCQHKSQFSFFCNGCVTICLTFVETVALMRLPHCYWATHGLLLIRVNHSCCITPHPWKPQFKFVQDRLLGHVCIGVLCAFLLMQELQSKHSELTCWIFPSLFVPAVAQEEVYREAVTDGYIIDNFYLNLFTTESSKTPGAAQASQQPSPEEKDTAEASGDIDDKAETSVVLQYGGKSTSTTPSAWSTQQPSLGSKESDVSEETEDSRNISVFLQHGGKSHLSTTTSVPPALSTQESKEIDLMEGSGEITDVSNFLQKGNERNVSTTTSVAPARSTGQPSSESEERDSSDGSGDTVDSSIFPQHGRRHNVPTTASVTHTQSPSTAVLPGDNDESGSGDMWLSDGDIIHATTSSSMSGSYTEMNMASNYMSAPRMINVAAENSSERRGKYTKTNSMMMTTTPLLLPLFIISFVFS